MFIFCEIKLLGAPACPSAMSGINVLTLHGKQIGRIHKEGHVHNL